jgi:hypothetical protein
MKEAATTDRIHHPHILDGRHAGMRAAELWRDFAKGARQ